MQMQQITLKKANHLKKPLVIILVVVFLFLIFGAIVTYNFDTHSIFSCGYSELEFPVPNNLKDSEIIFDKPIYGEKNLSFDHSCVSSFSDSNHIVDMLWMQKDSLTPNLIPNGMKFSLYKIVSITCNSLSCMDSGGGNFVLLKDNQGEIWEASLGHFDSKQWSALNGEFLFKASYYKNGVRLGDVIFTTTQ